MDRDLLRIVLLIAGVCLLLAIYLWDRFKHRSNASMEAVDLQNPAEPEPPSFSLNPGQEDAQQAAVEMEIESEIELEPATDSADKPLRPDAATTHAEQNQASADTSRSLKAPGLIHLSIVAREGSMFSGEALIQAFTELGLDFGEMDIFHRYDNASDTRLFSVASLVEPGTFPIDKMSSFEAPGLLLFLQPMGTPDPLSAFDELVHTCHELARRLAGEERDSEHNALTQETVESLRQTLMDGQ